MQKNKLYKTENSIIRVLDIQEDKVFVIDCIKRTMPKWMHSAACLVEKECSYNELLQETNMVVEDEEVLASGRKKIMRQRYTLIVGILPFVSDEKMRSQIIEKIAEQNNISKQTIRSYLCLYLVYQDLIVLAPKQKQQEKELTQDQKNMRWALNKFYYNKNKNSLSTAYTMMLKEKYCDKSGKLLSEHPSINQFRYFYKKYNKMQTYYISREGIKNYQRNYRPLLGENVQQFAPTVGTAMLDATVCDIYLVNDSGDLVGRPILTACIDAYSSLCLGYSLSWEGGTYSLRNMLLNVITDKQEHCKKHGIHIGKDEWNCKQLSATLVTDRGSEYISVNFEQLSELGVKVINLPSFRAELKGCVEKFFDLIQETYKKHLKGKGVIEPDFQERGSHDYRKDACLTLEQFEKIILKCILYYNSKRIIENFPYTKEMIKANVKPYANAIFEWGKNQTGVNLLNVTKEELIYTLLPRTQGKFTRQGLKVNNLRYKHNDYTEQFLKGGSAIVAYNPDDVSRVWLINNGVYVSFDLIESRFKGKELADVEIHRTGQREMIKRERDNNLQAQIDLAKDIQVIVESASKHGDTNIKQIRKTRKREQDKTHIDFMKVGVKDA